MCNGNESILIVIGARRFACTLAQRKAEIRYIRKSQRALARINNATINTARAHVCVHSRKNDKIIHDSNVYHINHRVSRGICDPFAVDAHLWLCVLLQIHYLSLPNQSVRLVVGFSCFICVACDNCSCRRSANLLCRLLPLWRRLRNGRRNNKSDNNNNTISWLQSNYAALQLTSLVAGASIVRTYCKWTNRVFKMLELQTNRFSFKISFHFFFVIKWFRL